MIVNTELIAAFDAIGTRARLSPAGMDFRVTPGEPGIAVSILKDAQGPFFDVRINYLRVVDLQVVEVDTADRYVVLAADDWGDELDAPARVFRCGVAAGQLYVDAVTELSSD